MSKPERITLDAAQVHQLCGVEESLRAAGAQVEAARAQFNAVNMEATRQVAAVLEAHGKPQEMALNCTWRQVVEDGQVYLVLTPTSDANVETPEKPAGQSG